jgi:hypothetical protein
LLAATPRRPKCATTDCGTAFIALPSRCCVAGLQGLERMDQIEHAVLERNGAITVVR